MRERELITINYK